MKMQAWFVDVLICNHSSNYLKSTQLLLCWTIPFDEILDNLGLNSEHLHPNAVTFCKVGKQMQNL